MMYFWFLLFVSLVLAANNEKLTKTSKVVLDARDFINDFYKKTKHDEVQRTVVSVSESTKKKGEKGESSYELVLKLDNKIQNEVCRLKVIEKGGKYLFLSKPECE
ncbi:hypothetical protein Bpfe_020257 [Biomphalaria pfeifferi]|uniref:Cystatin domain-containing protein n=1 Tax=Biomphalaria pfeifferi TaxID=112525 RepID=A0AAD8F4I1_BIOPF|nr:hypothetical protein Bpfe_020257 [Biomphalaria pfeifferi]